MTRQTRPSLKTDPAGLTHESRFSLRGFRLRALFHDDRLAVVRLNPRQPSDGLPERAMPEALSRELTSYFAGRSTVMTYPTIFITGTPFEQAVWRATRRIPPGRTRSYAWLAARVGRPRAARAVGRALSKNPLPIVFPCHRVIAADGRLGGFASGTDLKKRLLTLERKA